MVLYRLIAPEWLKEENPSIKRTIEGQFTDEQIINYNQQGYNIYFLPNYPSLYEGGTIDGFHIDTFEYVFVDMDLKDGTYATKEQFIEEVNKFPLEPSKIVDSGNGVHVYWRVTDLADAMSYLKLQRRLIRYFKTDDAVGQIYQLMRMHDTVNTKNKNDFKACLLLSESGKTYTCDQLDRYLSQITFEDEQYCHQHYDRTYNKDKKQPIKDEIPLKFAKLLDSNEEVKSLWIGTSEDRSKADFRLGHIMFASGFSKDEATSVLVNTSKALARAPTHRISYAENIVDKIWTFEVEKTSKFVRMSRTLGEILQKTGGEPPGKRFPCHTYLDNTHVGFRLTHVIGLVGGSGVGKTTVALNMFMGFTINNPDYDHLYVSLEQPEEEVAARWNIMCGDNERLKGKVQFLGNYEPVETGGMYRDLSLKDIKDYIVGYEADTGRKIGCVVIDHIAVLANNDKFGAVEGVKKICKEMKTLAIQTNTMLVMQSQTSREKSGIGDLELDKDAALGTSVFEHYCDYLITTWQPIKRCYKEGAPTVQAIKFCKIRHKKQHLDVIQEDVRYAVMFDPATESLRQLTTTEVESFKFWVTKATNKRKQDRKTEVIDYNPAEFKGEVNGTSSDNKDDRSVKRIGGLHSR